MIRIPPRYLGKSGEFLEIPRLWDNEELDHEYGRDGGHWPCFGGFCLLLPQLNTLTLGHPAAPKQPWNPGTLESRYCVRYIRADGDSHEPTIQPASMGGQESPFAYVIGVIDGRAAHQVDFPGFQAAKVAREGPS